MDFNRVKKAYFLGIGGIGVSAVARMFIHEGKQIGGSDTADSALIEELKDTGANVLIGQDLAHISEDTDLIIYTIAIEKFAPNFLNQVKEKFSNVISYPEALSIISKDKYTIAICGTHGKTTTTAMVAKILIDAGLDPTVIVGSILNDVHSNFVAGKSKYLVVEACEYCRSFLQINPTIVGITNIDADHLDYYKDINDIKDAFVEFAGKAEKVFGSAEDKNIKDVFESLNLPLLTYDLPTGVGVPGIHNKKNASIALAIAEYLQIPKEIAIESIKNFSGTWRRFEFKGKMATGAIVYDDYAHHPKEIEATLSGVREKFPDKKITVIFQPHLYSRTKEHFSDFAKTLSKADFVMLAPIYAAREEQDPSVSSKLLIEEIKKYNEYAMHFETFEEITEKILECSSENDVVIVMGAGDIGKVADILVKRNEN